MPQPGIVQPRGPFDPIPEAELIEMRRKAEAALDKPGPRLPAPGDDELKILLIAKYNAAFAEVKSVEAAYGAGTIPFDSIFEAQKRLLQAELELSDKPADQIAAFEKQLEMAKHVEQKVKSLALSYCKGGEADKYYQAKFQRLDAEIQLLRAKRKIGLAK